jgi:hypothetical protein
MLLGSSMQLLIVHESSSIGLPEVRKHSVNAKLTYSPTTPTVN